MAALSAGSASMRSGARNKAGPILFFKETVTPLRRRRMEAMIDTLLAVFYRDLVLSRRIGGGGSLAIIFFLGLVTIVPFGDRTRLEPAIANRSGHPVARSIPGDPARP